jgi:Transmembrane secretion effector
MQNVAAAWYMTSLSSSPLMVALIQGATSLPVFLVGLPAGAVADILIAAACCCSRGAGCSPRPLFSRLARWRA